ncbi:LppX_LprAFG lipoprotein [Nocardioides acrostichi]|uniref:LppX_LprAFG lipoprotein n=1 Tax=Nocardioides acrostichi TaxID=2784339 RepID=A0A930V0F6_9ACTN|nr:LppX_LprAFG lipoprotein [Nocardioides acrostichi]MBF4160954.1 LppX_LprAFG lipoprotein [Nocardioides acrostichi]
MSMRRALVPLALVPALLLTGCSGSDDGSDGADEKAATPQEALDAARSALDDTSGVTIALRTDALPDGVSGLLSAEGQATHAPAFDGSVTVRYSGIEPQVPIIAVDGKVYAQVPLTTGWSTIDPTDYGTVDPASLLAPDEGFSALLASVQGLEQGDQVRGGTDNKDILTTYTGTVPEESVAGIVPAATGEFDATLTLTDSDELTQMKLTGDFYASGDDVTYTVDFSDYGSTPDITAPE